MALPLQAAAAEVSLAGARRFAQPHARLQPRAPQAATPSHVSRYSGESADELGPKLLEELQFVRDAFHPGPNPVPCTLTLTLTLTRTPTP